ncbi:hypothetical protein BC332_27475 [Capsicum chinense]|nr:hypothetical protein BC332_27475 [Capsicum chinense]
MDYVQSSEQHLCYVRCNFCSTVLAEFRYGRNTVDRYERVYFTEGNLVAVPVPFNRTALKVAIRQRVPWKVGIPYKRLMDTVTVKCGHCSNLSFLSTRPPIQAQCFDHQPTLQGYCNEFKNKGQASSSASSTSSEPLSPPHAHFVVKPPEKKHRLPSAYNRFMK